MPPSFLAKSSSSSSSCSSSSLLWPTSLHFLFIHYYRLCSIWKSWWLVFYKNIHIIRCLDVIHPRNKSGQFRCIVVTGWKFSLLNIFLRWWQVNISLALSWIKKIPSTTNFARILPRNLGAFGAPTLRFSNENTTNSSPSSSYPSFSNKGSVLHKYVSSFPRRSISTTFLPKEIFYPKWHHSWMKQWCLKVIYTMGCFLHVSHTVTFLDCYFSQTCFQSSPKKN